MKKACHNKRVIMIQVVVSCVAHCDLLDAYGNFVFLGQIQEADEIWIETTTDVNV